MLRSLILSFIPESLRQDADEFRRARLLVTVSFTLMVLSLLSIVQDLFFVGFTLVDIPMLFAAVITAFTPTLMKQSASLKQPVALLVGTYIVVITILFFSFGGIKSNIHYFFIAAPILAFNLGGFKFGRTIGIGTMLLVIGLFVLEINAIVPLPLIRIPPQQIVYVTLTSTIFLVLFINSISAQSELSKEETTELLSETRAESERKAQEDALRQAVAALAQERAALVENEQKLLLANERLELATECGGIGVWDWDVASNTLVWDAQNYTLYRLKPFSVPGTYELWAKHVHPEDRPMAEAALQAAVRGERTFNTEFRIVGGDGEVRWLRGAGKVIRDAQGQAVRVVGANWDVT